jgi:hypothetical protein
LLLETALEYPGGIEFFLGIIPVEKEMLIGWIEDILQRGRYGLDTLIVLSKQTGMREFVLERLQDPNYDMQLSRREPVAKAMGIVLPVSFA